MASSASPPEATPSVCTQTAALPPTTTLQNPAIASSSASTSPPPKPFHSLVLDTGPLIKGDPAISTLLAQAEELFTIPAVLAEIRDEQTRTRINATLLPFLKLRNPKPESVKFVTDFARRTGDLEVLSRPDIHLIALTYELEIERNGGDWRLRNAPNQKRVNGSPPKKDSAEESAPTDPAPAAPEGIITAEAAESEVPAALEPRDPTVCDHPAEEISEDTTAPVADDLQKLNIGSVTAGETPVSQPGPESNLDENGGSDDSDGEWITPSNIKKHQAKERPAVAPQSIQRVLQACILTSDFAMQNVAIRINLNVVSPALSRITHLKSWVLRCHGCFTVTRKMDKQFCPSCGQPTLTRTSCSTDSAGNFKIHLKRNFQWNNRGNVFSIPKPVHGSASGKFSASAGGGKNGWGRELILAEDQKEYANKVEAERKTRYRDLMDEDYLPGLLTGDRSGGGGNGRIKVGGGRNINGKKRG